MLATFGEKHRLALLIALSLLIKGTIVVFTPLVNHDGPHYLAAAQEIAAGRFGESLRIYSMPLYPLLIAAANFLVDDWVRAGQIISILSLTLAIIPLYALTRMAFGAGAALWAGAAYVLWPLANDLAGTVYRDPPFLLFGGLAVHAAALALTAGRKRRHFFLASLLALMAFLCRMEGALFFPLFLLLWCSMAAIRPAERRSLLEGCLIFLLLPLAAAAVLAGLTGAGLEFNRLGNTRQRLHDLLAGGFLSNYRTVYARLTEMESTLPFGWWGGDFAEISRHHLWLVYGIGLVERLVKALSPVFLAFLFLGSRAEPESRRLHHSFLSLVGGNLLFLYLFYLYYGFLEVRYAFFPAFLLFPWIGAGLERAAGRMQRTITATGPALLLLGLVLFGGYRSLKGLPSGQDLTVREAGAWLAGQEELRHAPLVSNDCRVPFYAGRFRTYLPFSVKWDHDYLAMEAAALGNGGEVLAIRTSPGEAGSIPDFEHFEKIAEFAGRKHVVFLFRRHEKK